MGCEGVSRSSALTTLGGCLSLLTGLIFMFVMPLIFKQQIQKRENLSNGSYIYNVWAKPPADMLTQMWLYDVINPYEVVHEGAVPYVVEKGPYTYRYIENKFDIQFINESFVSYKKTHSYIFERDLSCGDENETITAINFPMLAAANSVRYLPAAIQKIIADSLELFGERLFETYSVKDYLWGYEEKTIAEINKIAQGLIHRKLIQHDRGGMFLGDKANNSNDGEYIVNTGVYDANLVNDIDTWNGLRSLEYWGNKECNMINGTDGTLLHPYIDRVHPIYTFSSYICRSFYYTYNFSHSVDDIKVDRYTLPASVLANAADNPANAGFCMPDCMPSGAMNLSACSDGAPIAVSQPHFYQASDIYLHQVAGMSPSASEHGSFLDVEPYTGAVLNLSIRLQLNAVVDNFLAFKDTAKISPAVIPLMWFTQSAVVTPGVASNLRHQLIIPMSAISYSSYVTVILGFILIIYAITSIVISKWRSRKFSVLREEDAATESRDRSC